MIVRPETVVGSRRQAFRLYWRFRFRSKTAGRPATCREIRSIIQRMAHENLTWGAPRIHGELLKLGVDVSERTVSRYLSRLRRNGNAGQRWRTFLKNHPESIAGMDFFTVITANFRILYCLFLKPHMITGRSSISIAHSIPPVNGSYNSSARRSPKVRRTRISSSIATRSLAPLCSISWTPAEFLPCGRVTGAPGKTQPPNAGFETTATNYSTM
jgi:hypothetical protein